MGVIRFAMGLLVLENRPRAEGSLRELLHGDDKLVDVDNPSHFSRVPCVFCTL